MNAQTRRLLADNRLSDGARILGLWIASQRPDEEGRVEVRFDAIRPLLHGFPSDDTLRRHLRMLRGSGWMERAPGGKGKGDLYKLLDPHLTPVYREDPQILDSGPDPSLSDRLGTSAGLSPDRLGTSAGLYAGSSRRTIEGSRRAKDAGARGAEPVPFSDEAFVALEQHDEILTGCRGALRDYLTHRVSHDKQHGYIQTVAGWLNGLINSTWRLSDGGHLEASKRPGILAAALNDLDGSDESKMRRPVGDPANLRTKLNILIRQEHDGHQRTDSGAAAGGSGGKAKRGRVGSNQPEHHVEW